MKTEPESPQCYAGKQQQKQANKQTQTTTKKPKRGKGRKNEGDFLLAEKQLFYSQVVKTNIFPRKALELPFLESSFL